MSADNLTAEKVDYRDDLHVKIFVCEYVTGGGLYRQTLPAGLAREGALMLQALLRDLAEIPGLELVTTLDPRVSLPSLSAMVIPCGTGDIWARWEACIRDADAVWPLAPESGGLLERLSRLVAQHGKCLLNSSPDAVALAASKYATCRKLADAGLAVAPTFRCGEALPPQAGLWVAKPDDGVGCEMTRCGERNALLEWLRDTGGQETHVLQPYLPGIPASLSMLCREGQAWLLSANRQRVALREGEFFYQGSQVNGLAEDWPAFELLASRVADAMPGLAGYVGVDVLVRGGALTLLEVNPRLTSSYPGLRAATGLNAAVLVLDLLYNRTLPPFPPFTRHVVDVSL